MKIVVIGKTGSVINLNKIGVPVRGLETAILNVDTPEKQRELDILIDAGLLEIIKQDNTLVAAPTKNISEVILEEETQKLGKAIEETKKEPVIEKVEKKKGGRPKGAKNKDDKKIEKPKAKTEKQKIAEAESLTQKMGSRAVVGTGNGVKEGRMTNSAIGQLEIPDPIVKESIDALKQLEEEENEENIFLPAAEDESLLDLSEQNGRKATMTTENGNKSVAMKNSVINEKQKDPFIDKDNKLEPPDLDFIDQVNAKNQDKDEDDYDESFIKI